MNLTEIEIKACSELIRRTKQDEKEHGTAIQHGAIITKDGNEVYYTSGLFDRIKIPDEILEIAIEEMPTYPYCTVTLLTYPRLKLI